MPEYVELGVQSAFSFLEGASLPEDLLARAAALGHGALALSDFGGVYGAPRFHRAAKKAGVRALVGAQVELWGFGRVRLLCESRAGYRGLCRLLTVGHANRPKGECVVGWDELAREHAGLTCLIGPGLTARSLALATRVRALFGAHAAVEIQHHLDRAETRRRRALVDLAEAAALPVVATGGVRFATAAEKPLADILACMKHHTTLDAAGRRLLPNAEYALKSEREMLARFASRRDALTESVRIAERLEFTFEDLGYRFPDYPVGPGESMMSVLRSLTMDGARGRYRPVSDKVRRQLEHELAVIEKLELAGYFLIVWDIVRFARAEGILAQGRGSAANSAVCYALGITAVDPVGMELLFERFLSEERGEWPDIDLDLPSGERRERVIQYVYRKYGAAGAAMTANVIGYRGKSAVREAGKALGFSPQQIDKVSKLFRRWDYAEGVANNSTRPPPEYDLSHGGGGGGAEGVANHSISPPPEYDLSHGGGGLLREAGFDPAEPRVKLWMQLAQRLLGLPRHLGQHSGGMVIAQGRLDEVVPLEPASMPGRTVVQWDKDDLADLRIIKVDLLGLGMLAVLEDAVPLIRESEGVDVDYAHLPAGDPKIYDMLCRADTVGLFQVESRAQMATLPRIEPRTFYDLVIEVAIIRPGPIVGKLVHPYINRRRGREPVTYAHPKLEPILARTLGVPLFQEQLMRVAMAVADFTGGEAEELRRAMGSKRSKERMDQLESKLRAGMTRNGLSAKAQDQIVLGITSFALYGFPESHSASFALIVYASAYLKAYHPAAFLCALLNNWPMGFYHPATLVKDAQRHDVRVLPVDVTRSAWLCTLEAGAVRLGLRYVVGLREDAGRRICTERAQAAFTSVVELERRCALRANELLALAELGAFAAFGHTRRAALWQVAGLDQQTFGLLGYIEPSPEAGSPTGAEQKTPGPLPEMSLAERVMADHRHGQMTVGPHAMRFVRPKLAGLGVHAATALGELAHGVRARVAGVVSVRQRPGAAKGFFFLTLEDETGFANVIVAPKVYDANRPLLVRSGGLLVEGVLHKQDGVVSLKGDRFQSLDTIARAPSRNFQ